MALNFSWTLWENKAFDVKGEEMGEEQEVRHFLSVESDLET